MPSPTRRMPSPSFSLEHEDEDEHEHGAERLLALPDTTLIDDRTSSEFHILRKTPDDVAQRSSQTRDGGRSPSSATTLHATDTVTLSEPSNKIKVEPVTWMSLPKKGQLAVLTLARLSEPLSERSMGAYFFYQLRSFDPSLPDSTITSQGGVVTAAFAGAQFFTAIWWGRAADSPRVGRKTVILIGLTGTAVATIGLGFSRSFYQALFFRLLAGALNGNVGVMRTMIGEMIEEKKFQSRAFLLMPMCFNIGVIIGPIMGGFLADPIHSFPKVFGPGSYIGGKDGVSWMTIFPYALPNIFSGSLIFAAVIGVIVGLDETHEALQHKPDWGRRFWRRLKSMLFRRDDKHHYTRVHGGDDDEDDDNDDNDNNGDRNDDIELQPTGTTAMAVSSVQPEQSGISNADTERCQTQDEQKLKPSKASGPPMMTGTETTRASLYDTETLPSKPKPGFCATLTPNILLTLLTHHLLALHVSTFNVLIFLFLPSPRSSSTSPPHFTLRFTGGLGLSTSNLGLATAMIGLIGFPLQILLYPRLNTKLGTLRSYRIFLPFSILAYILLPFIVLIPESKPNNVLLWLTLSTILSFQVLSRTFVLPSTIILINNCAPHPSSRGTIHGLAQSVSSAARMLGPTLGGWGLGLGLRMNCVGAVWWALAGVVLLNLLLVWRIWEGDGQGGRADEHQQ